MKDLAKVDCREMKGETSFRAPWPVTIGTAEDIPETPKVTVEMRTRILNFNSQKSKPKDKMVFEAISAIGGGGKGAAFPAITKWILATYAILDSNRLKIAVKKILLKCLEDGTLVRSQSSKSALGVSGSFDFPKEKVKNKPQGPKKTKKKLVSLEDNKIADDGTETNNKDRKGRKKV